MTPKPCAQCDATSFYELENVFVELATSGMSEPAHQPRFRMRVCRGCGHAMWFLDPEKLAAYWQRIRGKMIAIDIPPPTYRS